MGRKICCSFFLWLDLSGEFKYGFLGGVQNNLKIRESPAYPSRVVLQIKYSQTCFAVVLIFNAFHCICFIKFLRLGNSAWDFSGFRWKP